MSLPQQPSLVKRWIVLIVLCIPVAAWSFYKPVRVLAPGWMDGVTCVDDLIRLDQVTQ